MDESALRVTGEAAPRAKEWGLAALAFGAVVAVGAVIVTATLFSGPKADATRISGPKADATLQSSGIEPDDQLITLMESEGAETGLSNPPGFGSEQVIDLSTLRGFGAYRDIELWSAMNAFESKCLIAIHRATTDIIARQCAPAGVDVFIDTMWHGLSGGERLRFVLRGDTVDAFLLTPDEVG